MESVIMLPDRVDLETRFLRAWVETWIRSCTEFRCWERENLILKHPSPDTVSTHGRMIKTFIWGARMLQAMMADPDYPAREFRLEVEGLLRQLEESSDMIHNPMSDEECDALMQKHFPDEPRPGSTA